MRQVVERRLIPAPFGAGALIVAFLAWIVPTFVLPFSNVLPYLQSVPFSHRLAWSVVFFVVAVGMGRAAMTSRQWIDVRNTTLRGWSSVLGAFAGLLVAVYAAASLSANTFGLFVQIFPAEPFTEKLVVTTAKVVGGAKNRAIELELTPNQGEGYYELTLSKRVFQDLPTLKPGDVLHIVGERNLFGANVLSFTVH